jgi:ribosomal protein S18 acetylase RimI-like enzyme
MLKPMTKDTIEIIELIKSDFDFAWKKTNRKLDETFLKNKIKKAIKNDICLIKKQDKKIIAFGWAQKNKDFFGNLFGEIELLIVKKQYQKKGIGKTLLAKLEKKLNTKDLRLSCLTINPAKKLYKKQ